MMWLVYRQDVFVGIGRGPTAVAAIDDWIKYHPERRWLRGPYHATRADALRSAK